MQRCNLIVPGRESLVKNLFENTGHTLSVFTRTLALTL